MMEYIYDLTYKCIVKGMHKSIKIYNVLLMGTIADKIHNLYILHFKKMFMEFTLRFPGSVPVNTITAFKYIS